ncbi:MAG: SUMF1/EgtB/PvdO family nonheme iron enzyme [Deltaproteobacteria bacterium]|nr:SUMF1/EgtB/PvdO family nonheme iron enzyme [Deltaproteobacteria bacterium]
MLFGSSHLRLQGSPSFTGLAGVLFLGTWIGISTFAPGGKAASLEGKGKFAGMILIPAGPFTMGRDNGPPDEAPAHEVFLANFYIGRNLVTVADYAKFIQAKGPSGPQGEMYLDVEDPDALIYRQKEGWIPVNGYESYPAAELSWYGAVAYCQWLGKRLPSEAEWEKAARGKDQRLYPWGNEPPGPDLAFVGGFRGETVPVGQYPDGASPYGVLDMSGQLWEWTRSAHEPYPYDPKDGREELSAGGSRVARGGNAASEMEGLTATSREIVTPWRAETGHAYFGFRCAASGDVLM